MPFDFSNAIRPVDTAGLLSNLLRVRQAKQQEQLGAEELRSRRLQNQQAQMSIEDQQFVTKAYMDAGGDLEKTAELAAKYGARPQTIMSLKKSAMDHRESFAKMSKAERENMQKTSELIGQHSNAVLSLPPEQRKAAALQSVQDLAQQGVLDPQRAQQYAAQIQGLDDASLEQFLKVHVLASMETDKQLSNTRAAEKQAAEMPGVVADSQKKQIEAQQYQQLGMPAATREQLDLTRQGQRMTDARAREFNANARADREAARNNKPPSAAELSALALYDRAKDAHDTLLKVEDKIAAKGLAGQTRLALAPNWLQSEENQLYTQAQKQFTQAKLRRESGAAITNSEYEQDAKAYFAQPGDTKATLARKQQAREAAISEFKTTAGRAYRDKYGDAPAGGGGMVRMRAPNGQVSSVPAGQVEHYKSLGAQVVRQ